MLNKKIKRRLYATLWIMAFTSIAVGITLYALKGQIELYKTPAQVDASLYHDTHVFRLGGQVKPGSIRYTYDNPAIHTQTTHGVHVYFSLTDASQHVVPVSYHGVIPTLFREGKGAIVSGKFSSNGLFIATELLAKHDENYRPPTPGK